MENVTKCYAMSWIATRPHICSIDKSMTSHSRKTGYVSSRKTVSSAATTHQTALRSRIPRPSVAEAHDAAARVRPASARTVSTPVVRCNTQRPIDNLQWWQKKKSLQSEKQQVSGQPKFFFNNYAKSGRNHLKPSVRPGTSIVHA